MKPPFRLESILQLRIEHRDACRRELARALQAGEILAERQRDVQTELDELLQQLARQQQAPQVEPDAILSARRYQVVLKAQWLELENHREQVHQEAERRRDQLREADRDVRVLEKLKERKNEEWQARERRLAQAMLDEIASQRSRYLPNPLSPSEASEP